MSLVWESEPWWQEHIQMRHQLGYPWWEVRRSESNPALLAYFRSADNAHRDVWTQIKPGRYLTQYLAAGVLSGKQIKYWAEWQAKGVQPGADATPVVVHFADTPDEIERVYMNGPDSCMSHAASYYNSPCHPVRVYGAGDLAIAYLCDPDDETTVIARAICWPERKVFGRVYPTIDDCGYGEELRAALHGLEYHHAHECEGPGLDGARLLRIECRGGLVMPYLDAPYQTFDDEGDHCILRRADEGEHSGTETCGVVSRQPQYEYTCEHCDEGFDYNGEEVYQRCDGNGGRHSEYWCSYCAENHAFYCEGFGETFYEGIDNAEWDGNHYTQRWLDDNTFVSDFSGDRFDNDDAITMANGDVWAGDEAMEHARQIDGDWYPTDSAEAAADRRAAFTDERQEALI